MKTLLAYIYNLFVSQKTRMYAEELLHLTGKFTFPIIITATCHETLVVHDQTAIHIHVDKTELLILDPFFPEMEQQIARQRINEHYFRSISRTSLSGGG